MPVPLAHQAPPPRPLKRRLDSFLVRRRWDRRFCLVYRGVCTLHAWGRLFAQVVPHVRNNVELLGFTVFVIVLTQFVVRPHL